MYYMTGLYSIDVREIDADLEQNSIDFKHIVTIPMFYPKCIERRKFYVTDEYNNLCFSKKVQARGIPGCDETVTFVAQHVREWLDENVLPSTDRRCKYNWAWADPGSYSVDATVFFLRKRDAFRFMITFAEYINDPHEKRHRQTTV